MPASDSTARSGIYQIRCLINGKIYVGSALSIAQRWRMHRSQLSNGRHHSRLLQRAWQKYGADQFVFEVLEAVADKHDLIKIEQTYLDRLRTFDPAIGYNITPTAGSCLGVKATPETRAKQSARKKGRKVSPEAIEKTAAALRGRKRPPEVGAKISASKKGHSKSNPASVAALVAYFRANPQMNKGRKLSAEQRAQISAFHKGRKQDPEFVARRMAAMRARKQRPAKGQTEFPFSDSE